MPDLSHTDRQLIEAAQAALAAGQVPSVDRLAPIVGDTRDKVRHCRDRLRLAGHWPVPGWRYTPDATDRKLIAAVGRLNDAGEPVSVEALAAILAINKGTVRHRRVKLLALGLWPTETKSGRRWRELPADLSALVSKLAAEPGASASTIAAEVYQQTGTALSPSVIAKRMRAARGPDEWLETVRRLVRAEALREYKGRHQARPAVGEPVWQILRRHGWSGDHATN